MVKLKRENARLCKEQDFLKEAAALFAKRTAVRHRMIERGRDAFLIRMMCRRLGVSASGYCEWRSRGASARAMDNQLLLVRIRELDEASDGVLGWRRIHEDLRYEGESAGINRVGRLMNLDGLYGIPQKQRWRKKASELRRSNAQNHLEHDFVASEPNTKWATDITYVRTTEDWRDLCVEFDLYLRLVVGWSMSAIQDRQLVLQAVYMALWQRQDRLPLVLHSDRSC